MNSKVRLQWNAFVVLGIIAISLMIVPPAYADDSTPPTSGTEETTPVEETTTIVVSDDNGTTPLATEQTQQTVVEKDPIWCPTGVAPKPNTGGCTISFGSLSDLVTGFVPPAKNGTIWIEVGDDDGAEVEIDGGGTWAPAANYSLTLQGGWVGPAGPPPGNMAIVGTTEFDTAINIVGWNGAVTINDISFNGATNTLNAGTGSLYVETTKNIVVANVMAINSNAGTFDDGINLDNTSSTTQATVTVKNSTFNGNDYRGATILSDGAVTLINVTAHDNGNLGIYIKNDYDSTVSVVSVSNSSFNENGGVGGLVITTNGAVKLSQITAFFNTGSGVKVDNTSAPTAQPVTVSGYLHASNNTGNGLAIYSDGMVTLTSLITDSNGGIGTEIVNNYLGTPYAVTIAGFNSMSANTAGGLSILSLGIVTTNNIIADLNSGYGAYINNNGGVKPVGVNIKGVNSFSLNGSSGLYVSSSGAIATYNLTVNNNGQTGDTFGATILNAVDPAKPQNVTLFGVNTFNFNAHNGLVINSYGSITLSNVTASYNGEGVNNGLGYGAYISNSTGTMAKPVTLTGINTFNNNDQGGLYIFSLGAITVSNLTANYNTGAVSAGGVYLDNDEGLFQNPVTISGYGNFSNNTMSGLRVFSNGIITTANLYAATNGDNGVLLYTIGLLKTQTVTMKGNNTFNNNGNTGNDSGLIVAADGNITINNLTASNNFYTGAYLNNYTNWDVNDFPAFGSITLTGFGNFHNNGFNGLDVYTKGNLTMSYVTTNQNGDTGISIIALGKVTLTCVLTTNNAWGIYMWSPASYMTIKGLSAVGNTTNESLWTVAGLRSRCP